MLWAALRLRSEVHGEPVSQMGHPQYSVSELVANYAMSWVVFRLATHQEPLSGWGQSHFLQISEQGHTMKLVAVPDMAQVVDNDCHTVRVSFVVMCHPWSSSSILEGVKPLCLMASTGVWAQLK